MTSISPDCSKLPMLDRTFCFLYLESGFLQTILKWLPAAYKKKTWLRELSIFRHFTIPEPSLSIDWRGSCSPPTCPECAIVSQYLRSTPPKVLSVTWVLLSATKTCPPPYIQPNPQPVHSYNPQNAASGVSWSSTMPSSSTISTGSSKSFLSAYFISLKTDPLTHTHPRLFGPDVHYLPYR